jgi:hypothetical protein
MGTTFVTFGRDKSGNRVPGAEQEVGFWMRDGDLELWLRLLALHVEDPQQSGGTATTIRDQWLLASRGWFNGCVPHGLEKATATPEGSELVRNAVLSLSDALHRAPERISGGALSLLGFESGYLDIEVEVLRDIAGAFLDLLDFKVEATAHSTERMPGSISAPWRALP